MIALRLLPVGLSLLVLAAHFLRSGNFLVTLLLLGIVGLLAVRRPWAARTVQAVLLLGAVEWIRTLLVLTAHRVKSGEPAERMVLILGAVALLTALSALAFSAAPLRRRYRLGSVTGSGGA